MAFIKLRRQQNAALGSGMLNTSVSSVHLTELPWLLHCPFLDEDAAVRSYGAILQYKIIATVLVTHSWGKGQKGGGKEGLKYIKEKRLETFSNLSKFILPPCRNSYSCFTISQSSKFVSNFTLDEI